MFFLSENKDDSDQSSLLLADENYESFWKLVQANLDIVAYQSNRMSIYFPNSYQIDDLRGIGLLALIDSAKSIDPKRIFSFKKYASIRIKGALLDELRRCDKLSRSKRSKVKEISKQIRDLEQRFKSELKDSKICTLLGIKESEYWEYKKSLNWNSSIPLDLEISSENSESLSLHDIISDPNDRDTRDSIEYKEVVEVLKNILSSIPKVDQQVLVMYYNKGLKIGEISKLLHLSESRVSQIHRSALKKLKKILLENINK